MFLPVLMRTAYKHKHGKRGAAVPVYIGAVFFAVQFADCAFAVLGKDGMTPSSLQDWLSPQMLCCQYGTCIHLVWLSTDAQTKAAGHVLFACMQ